MFSFVVSKELLETPEDEIDPQKVPMKDLILLAEYRERLVVHILIFYFLVLDTLRTEVTVISFHHIAFPKP